MIGLLGLALIFIVYPIFKLLAESGHTMVIAWIYVFTVLLVVTFAIEIGQWYSGSGVMELADVAYGIVGFFVVFAVFAVVRGIFNALVRLFKKDEE